MSAKKGSKIEVDEEAVAPASVARMQDLHALLGDDAEQYHRVAQYVYRHAGSSTTTARTLCGRLGVGELLYDLHDVGVAYGPGFYAVNTVFQRNRTDASQSFSFSGSVGEEYGAPEPVVAADTAAVGASSELRGLIAALGEMAQVAVVLRGNTPAAPAPSAVLAASEKAMADLVSQYGRLAKARMVDDEEAPAPVADGEEAGPSPMDGILAALAEKAVPALMDKFLGGSAGGVPDA